MSLSGPSFRAYTQTDIMGVEVGGAVKNVIAIGSGIADGMGFGANTRVALITRGLAEMMRLGVKLGALRETFMGLAGLGDLVLTCTDDQSRNRRFGMALGRGASPTEAEARFIRWSKGCPRRAPSIDVAQRLRGGHADLRRNISHHVREQAGPRGGAGAHGARSAFRGRIAFAAQSTDQGASAEHEKHAIGRWLRRCSQLRHSAAPPASAQSASELSLTRFDCGKTTTLADVSRFLGCRRIQGPEYPADFQLLPGQARQRLPGMGHRQSAGGGRQPRAHGAEPSLVEQLAQLHLDARSKSPLSGSATTTAITSGKWPPFRKRRC